MLPYRRSERERRNETRCPTPCVTALVTKLLDVGQCYFLLLCLFTLCQVISYLRKTYTVLGEVSGGNTALKAFYT